MRLAHLMGYKVATARACTDVTAEGVASLQVGACWRCPKHWSATRKWVVSSNPNVAVVVLGSAGAEALVPNPNQVQALMRPDAFRDARSLVRRDACVRLFVLRHGS